MVSNLDVGPKIFQDKVSKISSGSTYISRMNVSETAKNLIDEILNVINRNWLFRIDDTM